MTKRLPIVDASLARGLKGIAAAGVLVALAFAVPYGFRGAKSALIGALLAELNLVGLAFVVRGSLEGSAFSSMLGLLKIALLFGATYLLVTADVVGALPLAFGYACLPLGLALGLTLPEEPQNSPSDEVPQPPSSPPSSPSQP